MCTSEEFRAYILHMYIYAHVCMTYRHTARHVRVGKRERVLCICMWMYSIEVYEPTVHSLTSSLLASSRRRLSAAFEVATRCVCVLLLCATEVDECSLYVEWFLLSGR